jgi:hypothetical protein
LENDGVVCSNETVRLRQQVWVRGLNIDTKSLLEWGLTSNTRVPLPINGNSVDFAHHLMKILPRQSKTYGTETGECPQTCVAPIARTGGVDVFPLVVTTYWLYTGKILWRVYPLLSNDLGNTFPLRRTRATIGHLLLCNGAGNTTP